MEWLIFGAIAFGWLGWILLQAFLEGDDQKPVRHRRVARRVRPKVDPFKGRLVIVDTETTGLDARSHRIVEIACVEMIDGKTTGEVFQSYVNPCRDVPNDVVKIHGLTNEFLADKPVFGDIVEDFLGFTGSSPLVMHNAAFDMKFINKELRKAKKDTLDAGRAICTLNLARSGYPGEKNNLNALCKRFKIPNPRSDQHSALPDCHRVAQLLVKMCG